MCINTKSRRSILNQLDADSYDLLDEYAIDSSNVYKWTIDKKKVPKVPIDWIENCLYYTGTVGITGEKGSGEHTIVPIHPIKTDLYRNARKWTASTFDPDNPISGNIVWDGDSNPALMLPYVPAVIISQYARIQASALISIGQNAVAMRQPVVVKGQEGKLGITMAVNNIEGGDTYIPVIKDNGGVSREIEVLDLHAQNFIDPLTGLVDATDGWMSARLGIDTGATQKASGVTVEEVQTMDARIIAMRDKGLEYRLDWCDRIKKALGITITVKISDGYNNDSGTANKGSVGSGVDVAENDKTE